MAGIEDIASSGILTCQPGTRRLLLIEDDRAFARAIQRALKRWGYQVEQAGNGEEALKRFRERAFDLALIDWDLPGEPSGPDLCRKLRSLSATAGLSFLTGKKEERDKIAGLNAGADDYIVKGCGLGELQARVEALYRRSSRPPPASFGLVHGPIEVDPVENRVTIDGAPISIPRLEWRLLVYLMKNAGRTIDREEIRMEVFGVAQKCRSSNVRDLVYQLRRRLGASGNLIQWRWRKGWGLGLERDDSVTEK